MKATPVWIYKDVQGEIYQIRVIHPKGVETVSVSNTQEKKLRRLCRDLYGRCQFTTVQVLPDEEVSQ